MHHLPVCQPLSGIGTGSCFTLRVDGEHATKHRAGISKRVSGKYHTGGGRDLPRELAVYRYIHSPPCLWMDVPSRPSQHQTNSVPDTGGV